MPHIEVKLAQPQLKPKLYALNKNKISKTEIIYISQRDSYLHIYRAVSAWSLLIAAHKRSAEAHIQYPNFKLNSYG